QRRARQQGGESRRQKVFAQKTHGWPPQRSGKRLGRICFSLIPRKLCATDQGIVSSLALSPPEVAVIYLPMNWLVPTPGGCDEHPRDQGRVAGPGRERPAPRPDARERRL